MSTNNNSELAREWPQTAQFKRSIRLEVSLYMSLTILLIMIVTGFVLSNQYVKSATRSVVEQLLVQARSYSGPAGKHILSVDGPDALMLNNICAKLGDDNKDVYWVGVTGNDGLLLAHTDIKRVISADHMPLLLAESFGEILKKGEAFVIAGDTIYLQVPIAENNINLGRLGLASSTRLIGQARSMAITTVVSITIGILLLGLPMTMIILHRKLRPISIITDHLKNIDFNKIVLDIPLTSANEFGYLAETLRVMGLKLNMAQKEIIEKERISRELEIAREIQANILPREYPRTPTFEFYGAYQSALEVGGDYYDFIEYDNDHIGFLVADVSGKSLPGMLVMLLTRDIVRRVAQKNPNPAALLSQVNEELLSSIKKGMFVTMFFGLFNKSTGHFTFASAGHNPLVWIRSDIGRSELLKTKGFPLGMVPPQQFDQRIETGVIDLAPHDWLIQYTDGINEAQDPECKEFGMERFVDLLQQNRTASPINLVTNVLEKHKEFVDTAHQYDDITLVAMKWAGVLIAKETVGTGEAKREC